MGAWIPIMIFAIPLFAIASSTITKVSAARLEEARLRAGEYGPGTEELRVEVEQMRHELNEVHERLDFAERLLANGTEERRDRGGA